MEEEEDILGAEDITPEDITPEDITKGTATDSKIGTIMIHTSYSGSTYNTQENISDASVLLNKFNTGNGQGKVWDGYCLAHLFTYWVLSNGLLGLSNIASPSATTTGGICSTSFFTSSSGTRIIYNTALSSYTSSSNPLVFLEEVLVTGHEIGHSWGSYHDPATTPSCSNVFIMNHRTSIGAVLSAKAQNCFTVRGTGVCGDYVVTSGEQCDAGLLGDTCCTDACQLRSTAMCRSLPVFLHWIPTFNIHLCNKNGGGHQGTLDYTMTMWKTMLKRCQLKRTPLEYAQREERRELELLYLLDKIGSLKADIYQELVTTQELPSKVVKTMRPYQRHLGLEECIRRYGNLRTFSGQGVENHNDDAKRVYFSSNKWNARIDCL
ncbi:hypothetical protein EMCRGX_G028403 [Ephydatia muelleri]